MDFLGNIVFQRDTQDICDWAARAVDVVAHVKFNYLNLLCKYTEISKHQKVHIGRIAWYLDPKLLHKCYLQGYCTDQKCCIGALHQNII